MRIRAAVLEKRGGRFDLEEVLIRIETRLQAAHDGAAIKSVLSMIDEVRA